MKVRNLILELSKLDPDLTVWKSRDAEGNGFMEVVDADNSYFIPTAELDHYMVEDVYHDDDFIDDDDLNKSEMTEVVVIW